MPILHLALTDGFDGDTVVIRIAGREVFNKEGVRTRYQIGAAEMMEVEAEGDSVLIEVELPEKGIAESLEMKISGEEYLEFLITPSGALQSRKPGEPFRFM